jgi:hypothetical protein
MTVEKAKYLVSAVTEQLIVNELSESPDDHCGWLSAGSDFEAVMQRDGAVGVLVAVVRVVQQLKESHFIAFI